MPKPHNNYPTMVVHGQNFTRICWVTPKAKQKWGPKLSQINKAWAEITWLSVFHGLRSCCVVSVNYAELIGKSAEWMKRGLGMVPIENEDGGPGRGVACNRGSR